MIMLMMSAVPKIEFGGETVRLMKRVEYERLASLGYFEDERVELLFGVVVDTAGLSARPDDHAAGVPGRQQLDRSRASTAGRLSQSPLEVNLKWALADGVAKPGTPSEKAKVNAKREPTLTRDPLR